MRALILNSGRGTRMGDITKTHPKCMTQLLDNETIISRQLKQLYNNGIVDVVITTGYYDEVLMDYCYSLNLPLNYIFVKNPEYENTNYIYSIYCARKELEDDILLLHGDLVFDNSVIDGILKEQKSCMKVSSTVALPEKDFKAVVRNNRVYAVGVNYFEEAMEAQAFYKLNKCEWMKWLSKIEEYCENDNRGCYAENAFNEISNECEIMAYDVKDSLCTEIDNQEDLEVVCKRLSDN